MTWKEEFEDKDFGIEYLGGQSKQMLFNFIESEIIEKLIDEIPPSAVTDEKWEDGKWVQYRSYHSLQQQLRAKWLQK